MRKFLGGPRKGLDQDTLGLPKPRILGKCKKGSAGIGTTQGSMLMDTRNGDRHVPSIAFGLEKG